MPNRISLELTNDELHTLALLGQTKRGTLTKVPKALLNRLLIDHGRLIRYCKEQGVLKGEIQ
jgi:hypothetical protein